MCMQSQRILVAFCCLATLAAASVSSVDKSALRAMGLSRKEIKEVVKGEVIEDEEQIEELVDEEEEPWKANDDWWKDPLAMFSDDEEGEEEYASIPEPKGIEPIEETMESSAVQGTQEEEEVAAEEEVIDEESIPTMEDEVLVEVLEVPKTAVVEKEKEVEVESPPKAPKQEPPKAQDALKGTSSKRANRVSAQAKGTSSDTSKASPAALLLPLLPKVQKALGSIPLVQTIAAAVIAKTFVGYLSAKQSHVRQESHDEYLELGENEAQKDRLPLENGRRVVQENPHEDLDEIETDETQEEEQEMTTETPPRARRRPAWLQGVSNPFTRTYDGQRIPPARELLEQIDSLKHTSSRMEAERDSMEREYEKASFQLQEAQTELATLTTNTRYLKAQLRDNEEVMNKAVRAERRKAKEELARMKEAMVGILEKERRAMREELKRQTTELRALLAETTGEESAYVAEHS